MPADKDYREGCDEDELNEKTEPPEDMPKEEEAVPRDTEVNMEGPLEDDPGPGPEETVEQTQVPQTEEEKAHAAGNGTRAPLEMPVTGFLVIVRENGAVDAVVDLPQDNFPRKRQATLSDIRDACASLKDNVQITMVANATSQVMAKSMAQMAESQMVQRMRASMGGRPQ